MATYKSLSGKSYTLGNELGAGGEGIVYEICGDTSKVAKIYKNEKFKTAKDRNTMDRKLQAMVRMNIPVIVEGKLRLAWPLDILYQNGSMVGFVMPRITARCKIFDIQRVDNRQPNSAVMKIYPNYNWKYSVQFAYNLAWVVKYVHENNFVVGDLNQNNIYVDTSTGAVILIDCDSFDIKDPISGEHFPCVVGLPEMLAPELQTVGHLKNGTFTEETDNFSLAIHIFRLLMKNADPFGGITNMRSVSNIPANVPIINGECAYVKTVPGKSIPGWSPTLDMLPPDIQNLFRKTFDYAAVNFKNRIAYRTTASEWCAALAVLGAPEPNPNLQKCSVDPRHHVYPKYSSYCPWCRCENYSPVVPVKHSSASKNNITKTNTSLKPVKTITGTSNTQKAAATSSNSIIRRKPHLFYMVLIAFGLASGFVFGRYVSQLVNTSFEVYLSQSLCTMLLSVVGVIGGALIAHRYEDKYTHADNAIPWLFLGIGVLFVPLLVAIALGITAGIIIAVVAMVVAVLQVIFTLICVIAICIGIGSGS